MINSRPTRKADIIQIEGRGSAAIGRGVDGEVTETLRGTFERYVHRNFVGEGALGCGPVL